MAYHVWLTDLVLVGLIIVRGSPMLKDRSYLLVDRYVFGRTRVGSVIGGSLLGEADKNSNWLVAP